jgi:hypothetical protein
LWVVDDVARVTYNVTLAGGLNVSFGTPNTAISSIAVDPVDGTLWGVNEGSSTNPGKLVNYSRTGVVIQQIPSDMFGAFGGEGLAVTVGSGGGSLWVVDDPDPSGSLVPTVYNVARDGSLLSSFATSSFSTAATSPQAIAYDTYSDSLWITDNAADAVFNVSTTGVLLGSFPTDAGPFVTAVTNVQGITVESATHLWITGRTTGMLYRVTKTGTRISHSFPASVFDPAASNPTGVAFDTSTPAASHRQALTTIRDHLAVISTDLSGSAAGRAGDAVKELDKALGDNSNWDPDGSLNSAEGKGVFDKMKRAVEKLLEVDSPPAPITTAIDALVELARDMAQANIDEAVAAGGDPGLIAEANGKMAKALDKIAKGEFDKAINEYKRAWEKARDSLLP